jgi:2-hydroxy-3-oxopropionate reductase
MGKPIAVNLVKAGFDVTVVNRSQGKVEELVGMGAKAGTTPAALARDVDVVMTCLLDQATVELVVAGPDGVLEGAHLGLLLVDISTQSPVYAASLGERCAAKGMGYLEAPVSGAGEVAWEGRLTVMVGGERKLFDQMAPVFDAIGTNVQYMGTAGSGSATKLVNNLMKDINMVGVMEGMVLGAKLGIDADALFAVLRTASSASRQLERITPRILARDFAKTSSIKVNVKDETNIRALADESGLTLPLQRVVQEFFERAAQQGRDDEDPTASIKLLEEAAGVVVKGAGS